MRQRRRGNGRQRLKYVFLLLTGNEKRHARCLLAEFIGSALLVAVVVGSGIAAAQLSPDDVGLQLLENSVATALGLGALILMFGPVSGAHFNPVVSLADWALGRRRHTGINGRIASPTPPSRRWRHQRGIAGQCDV